MNTGFQRVKKVKIDFFVHASNRRKVLFYRLFCDNILYSRRALPPRAPLLLCFCTFKHSSLTVWSKAYCKYAVSFRYNRILPRLFITNQNKKNLHLLFPHISLLCAKDTLGQKPNWEKGDERICLTILPVIVLLFLQHVRLWRSSRWRPLLMGLYPNHIKTAIFASNSAYFAQILSYIQNFCSTFCNVTYLNPQLIFRHQLRVLFWI